VIREVKNGGGLEYSAIESHRRAEERNKQRYEILSARNKGICFKTTYKTRIENLEMQVEILHDTIKGILNEK